MASEKSDTLLHTGYICCSMVHFRVLVCPLNNMVEEPMFLVNPRAVLLNFPSMFQKEKQGRYNINLTKKNENFDVQF